MFIAALKQKNEGCDYTIGCDIKVIKLASTKQLDAINELKT